MINSLKIVAIASGLLVAFLAGGVVLDKPAKPQAVTMPKIEIEHALNDVVDQMQRVFDRIDADYVRRIAEIQKDTYDLVQIRMIDGQAYAAVHDSALDGQYCEALAYARQQADSSRSIWQCELVK